MSRKVEVVYFMNSLNVRAPRGRFLKISFQSTSKLLSVITPINASKVDEVIIATHVG